MIVTIIIKSIKITHEIVDFIIKYYHKFYLPTKTLFNKCYNNYWIPTKNFAIKCSKHKYVSKFVIKFKKYSPLIITGFSYYFYMKYPCYFYCYL